MYSVTYQGIFITRSFGKPENLKNMLVYKGFSKKVEDVYFHEDFQDGWKDILENDKIKESITICVFKNYIGPEFKFYDDNFISVWNKSKNVDGSSSNIKIFFDPEFKFKEQIKKYMINLGFIFVYENSDRLVYEYDSINVSKILYI